MWLLILTVAMAPSFDQITTQTRFLSERDCLRALHAAVDVDAQDGVMIVGKCVQAERRK